MMTADPDDRMKGLLFGVKGVPPEEHGPCIRGLFDRECLPALRRAMSLVAPIWLDLFPI